MSNLAGGIAMKRLIEFIELVGGNFFMALVITGIILVVIVFAVIMMFF